MRKYQVFPGRTHPEMQTSGTGGYLLHATYVWVSRLNSDQYVGLTRSRANSFPNHEAGWLTAASVRKRNRQNEREKSKKAKIAQEEDETAAATQAVVDSKTAEAGSSSVSNSLITGYVRVPQVSPEVAALSQDRLAEHLRLLQKRFYRQRAHANVFSDHNLQ